MMINYDRHPLFSPIRAHCCAQHSDRAQRVSDRAAALISPFVSMAPGIWHVNQTPTNSSSPHNLKASPGMFQSLATCISLSC